MSNDETQQSNSDIASMDDVQAVEKLRAARDEILTELRKSIVGMDDVIDQVMISIFARGHGLLEGVPGLAKTLLVSSIAKCLSLSFRRIQFTPDLMPSDITGTEVLQDDPETGARKFMFTKGPIFANMVLADEINRTPPKTQAALLEAMQEKMISAGGDDYKLDLPFFVLATQNPLEQEGTYPLPEAQLDRFMFKIHVEYPTEAEEIDIMRQVTAASHSELKSVISKEEILALQELVLRVPVADHIFNYTAKLVRATRPGEEGAPDFINDWVSFGTGPRACLNLILAGKARAILQGRFNVSIDDIQTLALPVMRHRMGLNFAAQSEGVRTDDVIRKLLEHIPSDEKMYKSASA
ncbi:MAG: MoxR family ATPase [Opitutae bacterium]|jgi:MoxR-like ATPase|nr:MoxR family ATPase [Opitutae bacterium]MBT6803962.1 MoxR family ATPase [Verrucomicrobiota bacterium]MBT4225559.1 MoxR family ATPase [Opitutae bacterium]MBT5689813.1 MoxR family ATPase [Opitutae bacterium]MBT6463364.1 MoxR family ATPase [Opitutae bacterium]